MGLRTVAVHSDADRAALHTRTADECVPIGPAPSRESYLVMERIIAAARDAGCDAIHPGYGFLSENADFAQAVADAGLIFIGPPASAIRAMGDKTSAKSIMRRQGVPVLSGTTDAIQSDEEALRIAAAVGYPVLIKAAAGGGGKGMRVVHDEGELLRSVHTAQNEARQAFGSDRVYIEKYLESPRHIEFQILADAHGRVVHLGERECSVQRRHQKVIEECPSSVLTPELRERMGESAVKAAQGCGYINAGTVEFLLDGDMNYYFLEMNTRLQVEHPVTEMVTGLDLVKLQIRIAQGVPLPFTQDQVLFRGHAIEARLCAEDVTNNFYPSTGTIQYYRPSQGFGVREDSGISEGAEISIYYDPMFAKLIAWGENRMDAIDRLKRALREYRITGVDTTIPFCLFVLEHPDFVSGNFTINFIPQHYSPDKLPKPADDEVLAAVLFALHHANGRSASGAVAEHLVSAVPGSRWVLQHRGGRH